MKLPVLRYEKRRTEQLRDELERRAQVWLPERRPGVSDAAGAIFQIAARLESEVTQRLDRAPEKNFRGLLSWLGARGDPGHAARLPIAMKLTRGAEPVLVDPPCQLQVSVDGQTVIFETSKPFQATPANLVALIGADPASDKFYQGPTYPYEGPKPTPTVWRVVSDATAGATDLQLDPPVGLAAGLTLCDATGTLTYQIIAANGGLVTIAPGLGTPNGGGTPTDPGSDPMLFLAAAFDPFGAARDQQQHAIYFGSTTALDVSFPAAIEIRNAQALASAKDWKFWGKLTPSAAPDWLDLVATVTSDGIVLRAAQGAFDVTTVGGKKSRWIRALGPANPTQLSISSVQFVVTNGIVGGDPPKNSDTFTLCGPDAPPPPTPVTGLDIEGVANTTPLVLDSDFYPLGREPRLFDAFYLGWDEAFSKSNADIRLKLTIGGGFGGPLAAVKLATENIVAAVGDDRTMRLVRLPVAAGAKPAFQTFQPTDSQGRPVGLTPGQRAGAVELGGASYFSASSGSSIWLWSPPPASSQGPGDWHDLGSPTAAGVKLGDTALVPASDGRNVLVYAVSDGKLYSRVAPAGSSWAEVPVGTSTSPAKVVRVAPIVRAEASAGAVDPAEGLIVVAADGDLFSKRGGAQTFTRSAEDIDPDVYPLAVSVRAGGINRHVKVFARAKSSGDLIAFDLASYATAEHGKAKLVGASFGFQRKADKIVATFVAEDSVGARSLAIWDPFDTKTLVSDDPLPGLVGAPAPFGATPLIPMQDGVAALSRIDPKGVKAIVGATVGFAAVLQNDPQWSAAPHLLVEVSRLNRVFSVDDVVGLDGGRVALELSDGRDSDQTERLKIYPGRQDDQPGVVLAPGKLELVAGDPAAADDLLFITWGSENRLIKIKSMGTNPAGFPVATLKSPLPNSAPVDVTYRKVDAAVDGTGLLRPTITAAALPDLSHADLNRAHLEIDDQRQGLLAATAALMVLASPWKGTQTPTSIVAVTAFAKFEFHQPPRPTNPGLSWEYWNGSGWWHIPGLTDGTANLVQSGEIRFCVPPQMQPTDVVGRNHRWIRARLVGGDYGQEVVKLIPLPPPQHGQQVERDTSNIRAPYVVGLQGGYQVCCPLPPEFVLTADNGGVLDQTAASVTKGAHVSVFTPLAQALAPPAALAPAADHGTCGCAEAPAPAAPARGDDCSYWEAPKPEPSAGGAGQELDRAIYLGFDSSLQGTGVSLLFRLKDMAFDGAFPLVVEGFANGAFAPIACDDGTRGLGETGLLDLSLPIPLQQAAFFGKALFWLRLKPNPRLADKTTWTPQILGVYPNAAWATAAETQSNEVVGSSDGSPSLSVSLARPPIVEGTLALRVLERLGDEEVDQLRATGPTAVLDQLGPWAGKWVRWTLGDLDAAGPQDRVYDLDASTGVVTFGTGRRGRIPPIAMNNIVAETYQTGGGAAANDVEAWSQLSLITPVQGVETTIAPEGATGGADPQDVAAVLRFGPAQTAMRGRAVTLRDFELLAFESSSKIGQTRALAVEGGVRVIAVMRGQDPLPSNADRRALTRFLQSRASPGVTVEVAAPRLVQATIKINAAVPDLGLGADVVQAVAKRLAVLLDPATGGFDGYGWRLGDMLTDADVAACLDGVPNLDSFTVDIQPAAGVGLPLKSDQLLQTAPDGLVLSCQSDETEAAV